MPIEKENYSPELQQKIIDGREIASQIKKEIKNEVENRIIRGLKRPSLSIISIGDHLASSIYIRNKNKACDLVGYNFNGIKLDKNTSEDELISLIESLNKDSLVNGILVQVPIPGHINQQRVIEAIDPRKDVDGFHPYNMGMLAQKTPILRACTPHGVMNLIEHIKYNVSGKDAVVVGASTIVGRPMAFELLLKHATVTICHSKTNNLEEKIRNADILVAAIGSPMFIKGSWIKKGAVVIDVGINRLEDGKIVGDVEFDEAIKVASFITPVPRCVGPMTIAMLLKNTLIATEWQEKINNH